MAELKEGEKAPDFSLSSDGGKNIRLSDYKGKWLLLYFYPKDNTMGCIKEACSIRDLFPEYKKSKIAVLGVSVDPVKSHKKFREKYKLPFTLLSDEEKRVVKKYGVWGEKKFMGRTYMGTYRTSFLIDPRCKVVKIYERVMPESHAQDVLSDARA